MVVLCADEVSLRYPELLGLSGENLDAQTWLSLHSCAHEVRDILPGVGEAAEIWVVSSDDMLPINLAAALKKDNPSRRVLLITPECSGSLKSRVAHAGLDGVLPLSDFPALYAERKAAAEGAAQVLPDDEGAGLALRADLGSEVLSECAAPADTKGFLLPVVSGSGGVGKSSLSVVLAALSAHYGMRTVLVDLDLQFGDVREILSAKDAVAVDEYLVSPLRASQVHASSDSPVVLAAPGFVEQAETVTPHVSTLLDGLRESFDVVVVNTGSFWTDSHIQLLEACDKALFVMDQRPSSLRACRKALDLCTRCGIAASPFVVVVNRCSKNAFYTSVDASCALQGIPAFELKDGGAEIEDMMAAGCISELIGSKNPFVESVDRLVREIVPTSNGALPDRVVEQNKKKRFSFLRKSSKGMTS